MIRDQWDAAKTVCWIIGIAGSLYAACTVVQIYFMLKPLWSHV